MDRLTINKSVSEMGMYELAHNSCYTKDGKACIRDFENEFDARKLTIKLLEKYADIPNEFTCDDDFDEFITDALQYGTDSILGLIALFYRNLWAMADLRERLREYEDLEEQGKLLKLPCAVGDKIWSITSTANYSLGFYSEVPLKHPEEKKIVSITLSKNGCLYHVKGRTYSEFDFGKTVFLTREEAEAALKEMSE